MVVVVTLVTVGTLAVYIPKIIFDPFLSALVIVTCGKITPATRARSDTSLVSQPDDVLDVLHTLIVKLLTLTSFLFLGFRFRYQRNTLPMVRDRIAP